MRKIPICSLTFKSVSPNQSLRNTAALEENSHDPDFASPLVIPRKSVPDGESILVRQLNLFLFQCIFPFLVK